MGIATAGLQDERFAAGDFNRKRIKPAAHEAACNRCEKRCQVAAVDQYVSGQHDVVSRWRRLLKPGLDAALYEFSVQIAGACFLQHQAGDIDAGELAAVSAKRRTAQAGTTTQIHYAQVGLRRQCLNLFYQCLRDFITEFVDQPTVEIAGKIIKQAARIGVGGAEGCFAFECAQQMTEAVDIDATCDGRFEGRRSVERVACQGVETAEI